MKPQLKTVYIDTKETGNRILQIPDGDWGSGFNIKVEKK